MAGDVGRPGLATAGLGGLLCAPGVTVTAESAGWVVDGVGVVAAPGTAVVVGMAGATGAACAAGAAGAAGADAAGSVGVAVFCASA